MHSAVDVRVHDTDPDLFATLARVFGEESGDTARWVQMMTADGVKVTFFVLSNSPAPPLITRKT